jgi:hypothetical protein
VVTLPSLSPEVFGAIKAFLVGLLGSALARVGQGEISHGSVMKFVTYPAQRISRGSHINGEHYVAMIPCNGRNRDQVHVYRFKRQLLDHCTDWYSGAR